MLIRGAAMRIAIAAAMPATAPTHRLLPADARTVLMTTASSATAIARNGGARGRQPHGRDEQRHPRHPDDPRAAAGRGETGAEAERQRKLRSGGVHVGKENVEPHGLYQFHEPADWVLPSRRTGRQRHDVQGRSAQGSGDHHAPEAGRGTVTPRADAGCDAKRAKPSRRRAASWNGRIAR